MSKNKQAKIYTVSKLTALEVMQEASEKQGEIDELKDSVAGHLFEVAQRHCLDNQGHKLSSGFNLGSKGKAANEYKDAFGFMEETLKAEKWVTTDTAKAFKMESVPKCWSDAKSIIKRANELYGLNPIDYDTFGSYRDRFNELKAKDRAKSEAAEKGDNSEQAAEIIKESELAGVLALIAKEFEHGNDETKDALKKAVEELAERYRYTLDTLLPVKPEVPVEVTTGVVTAH